MNPAVPSSLRDWTAPSGSPPPPDPAPWAAVADPRERLRIGLGAIYRWFEHNAGLIACVLADAEHHPLVREVSDLRFGPHFDGWGAALAEGADGHLLRLALSFHSWRTLTGDGGLDSAGAAAAMAAAVAAPAPTPLRVAAAE